MASPATIRQALQARLAAIQGLRVYDRWPNQINVPCAILTPSANEPLQVFGRGEFTRWNVDVHLLVGIAGGIEVAQERLDGYLNTSTTGGIFGVIANDGTLGGNVQATFVRGYQQYEIVSEGVDAIAYQGAVVNLEIWSS